VGKADLKGLPPATVITAEIDPPRSEGKALADKLKSAGVDVTYQDYKGVTHEFFGMADVVGEAKQAQALAAKELREALARPGATGSTRRPKQ
jgi:acetyl esterase/lipase